MPNYSSPHTGLEVDKVVSDILNIESSSNKEKFIGIDENGNFVALPVVTGVKGEAEESFHSNNVIISADDIGAISDPSSKLIDLFLKYNGTTWLADDIDVKEAPQDDKLYVRKNGTWEEISIEGYVTTQQLQEAIALSLASAMGYTDSKIAEIMYHGDTTPPESAILWDYTELE